MNRLDSKETKAQATHNRKFWKSFLSKSHDRRSPVEWDEAASLAFNWNTCACGSINDGLPRGEDAGAYWAEMDALWIPNDAKLRQLGGDFYEDILARDLTRARSRFNAIQKRAGEVLDKEAQYKRKQLDFA